MNISSSRTPRLSQPHYQSSTRTLPENKTIFSVDTYTPTERAGSAAGAVIGIAAGMSSGSLAGIGAGIVAAAPVAVAGMVTVGKLSEALGANSSDALRYGLAAGSLVGLGTAFGVGIFAAQSSSVYSAVILGLAGAFTGYSLANSKF